MWFDYWKISFKIHIFHCVDLQLWLEVYLRLTRTISTRSVHTTREWTCGAERISKCRSGYVVGTFDWCTYITIRYVTGNLLMVNVRDISFDVVHKLLTAGIDRCTAGF